MNYVVVSDIFQDLRKEVSILHNEMENSMSRGLSDSKASLQVNSSTYRKRLEDKTESKSPCKVTGVTVDCSGLSLDNIGPSWFTNATEIILLNNNNLTNLSNFTFYNCPRLKRLDLSHNKISHVEFGAFENLSNLLYLSLSNNLIILTAPFTLKEIFRPLINLTELNLMYNVRGHFDIISYTLLDPLTKLSKLSLEYTGDQVYFGVEFYQYHLALKVLVLTGTARTFDKLSFKHLYSLEELTITSMKMLTNISQDVFQPLINLRSLTIQDMYFPVQQILSMLWPFTNRTMTKITLDGISRRLNAPISLRDVYVTEEDTTYLRNICVNSLTIRHSLISYITKDAFRPSEKWHRCLQYIDLSYNPILGNTMTFLTLFTLRSLETFVANEFLKTCNPFSKFSYVSKISTIHRENRNDGLITHNDNPYLNQIKQNFKTKDIKLIFSVPKTLKTVIIHSSLSSQFLSINILFLNGDNVKYLDISDNDMFYSFQGQIQGLTSLETAIFSRNSMSDLAVDFFDTFPTLTSLAIAKCHLLQTFFSLFSNRVFQKLTLLQRLDLSINYLNILSLETFSYNSKLQWIDLSVNQFREIPFNLKYTPELLELNMSNNVITTIKSENLKEIENLLIKNGKFQLSLGGNILSCGCSDLHFLQWIKDTKVTFDHNANFTCINEEGVLSYTAAYSDLKILWRKCWGQFYLYLALIVMCLYAAGFVTVFLFLRNKRFLVSYLLQILGHFRFHTMLDYNIGVYIGYADKDYQFPCNGLRYYIEKTLRLTTFINDRDLLPSLDRASGIVDAINKSWRIVLVCSEAFLNDDWSLFTMRSSIYAQSPANSSKIVVMVHRICVNKLPTELLSAVNDENIIVVSEWELTYEIREMLRTRLAAR
ncbi:hypothetical protein Btru_041033 [Bulinus truncatus]|nr:hypothetical protein Btru_041033 [Bulinus truncatus]